MVHNGIIENHAALRARLKEAGFVFKSETDTEVIGHLVSHHRAASEDLLEAAVKAVAELEGAFAIALVSADDPGTVVVARKGAPLLLGLGDGENFAASDVSALVQVTRRVVYLEDGDCAEIRSDRVRIVDSAGRPIERAVHLSDVNADAVDLGPYRHYMQKEIFEQPGALANTLEIVGGVASLQPGLFGAEAEALLRDAPLVQIVACGTSFHAGLVAAYWIESLARIPVRVDIASEFRYRDVAIDPRALVVTISQSGETADTLAAIEYAKSLGCDRTLTICNVPESSLLRASRLRFLTRAGPEIGVASTKAFTTQLSALYLLALVLAGLKGKLSVDEQKRQLGALRHLPAALQHVLSVEDAVARWAKRFAVKQHALFLGRGVHYPIAMEGALKLKEISYIHAEGYAAGELKHGPIALIDEHVPVIVIAPSDELSEKTMSNLEEVLARKGRVILITDGKGAKAAGAKAEHIITVPEVDPMASPLITCLPVQLLAYHTAVLRGTDVDQPRNLAKSVTVE